jgi:hypothetical protein
MYFHTTDIDTLDKILAGDSRLYPLKQLAEVSPDASITVESQYNSTERKKDTVRKLYEEALANNKQTDAVFFTKDKYLPTYGDVLIAKDFKPRAVQENKRYTTIPDEYLRKNRFVSLRNATIYVPEEALEMLRAKYPKANLQGYNDDSRPAEQVTAVDRLIAAIAHVPKIFKGASADEDAQQILDNYRHSVLVGSEGLGISNKTSDHDIIIPTNTELGRKRLRNRIAKQYPDLYVSREDEKKTTFSGDINGNEFNIALIPHQYADPFIGGYMSAKDYLDQHENKRQRIRKIKKLLAMLPMHSPYKWYKKYVDHSLGISRNYI